jgi:hypothetical protein
MIKAKSASSTWRHSAGVGGGGERRLHVEAGGEGAAGAAHDDRRHRIVVGQRAERGARLADQPGIERVQHFRPVEGEDRDALPALDADRLVAHPFPFN